MHKLALRMGRTVTELSAVMSVEELSRWFAFDRLSPIGDERHDMLLSILTINVLAAAGAKRTGGGKFRVEDFMPFKLFKPDVSTMTPLQAMRTWLGGTVKRKPRR